MFGFLLNFIPGVGPLLATAGTILSNVLDFVMKHWKFFAIASLVGCIAYQNFEPTRFVFGLETIPHEQLVIKQDQVQIANLKDALNQAVTANQKLTTSIGALNTTVGEWEAKTSELQKENDALAGKLADLRVQTNKKVQDILNSKTPTSCEASIDFLRTEKGGLTW